MTCSSVEDGIDELFIQLDESDEDSVDVRLEGKLIDPFPNSTSRHGYKDK